VLLVTRDEVPEATRAELARLAPDQIIVLGGATAVSEATLDALDAIAPARRVAGANRFATAAAVAGLLPPGPAAYVVTGANFPDALAGSAVAGARGAPVLLTALDDLPDETAAALAERAVDQVWVLGGTGVVSDDVLRRLAEG
jgi:putative cell wall-binding protein